MPILVLQFSLQEQLLLSDSSHWLKKLFKTYVKHRHFPHAADGNDQDWWLFMLRRKCKLMPHVPAGSISLLLSHLSSAVPAPPPIFPRVEWSCEGSICPVPAEGAVSTRSGGAPAGSRGQLHPTAPGHCKMPLCCQACGRLAHRHRYFLLLSVGFKNGRGRDKKVCDSSEVSACALHPFTSLGSFLIQSLLWSRSEGILPGNRTPRLVTDIMP